MDGLLRANSSIGITPSPSPAGETEAGGGHPGVELILGLIQASAETCATCCSQNKCLRRQDYDSVLLWPWPGSLSLAVLCCPSLCPPSQGDEFVISDSIQGSSLCGWTSLALHKPCWYHRIRIQVSPFIEKFQVLLCLSLSL